MHPRLQFLPAFSLLFASTLVSAAGAQELPEGARHSAPASQAVATPTPSALPPPPPAPPLQPGQPDLQLEPAPFPSSYSPSLPPPARSTLRGWAPTSGRWGSQRERPEPKPPTESVWYGWQTLLMDAATIPALTVPELGVATYFLGSPIVHWAHGNTGRGFASMGLRVGAPLVLGYLGAATCDSTPHEDCFFNLLAGAALGVIAAITIDAAALARETVPVEKTTISLGPVRMMPSLASSGKQTTLSLSGTF